MNPAVTWTRTAIGLHWLMAVLIVVNLLLGFVAVRLELSPAKLQVYLWHKSIGLTVLALALLRIVWRLSHAPPASLAVGWQRDVAARVHGMLYLLLLAIPLSGWWLNSAANFPLNWFGWLPMPALVAPDKIQRAWAGDVHMALAWLLIGLVLAHAGAALQHHIWGRDETLRRFLPKLFIRGLFILMLVGLPAVVWVQSGLSWDTLSNLSASDQAEEVRADAMSQSSPWDAQAWLVDARASRVEFVASYDGTPVPGQFRRYDAQLHFDPQALSSSGFDVRIDTGSLDTLSPERDEAIVGEPWFAVAQFPQAHFQTGAMQRVEGELYEAQAQLRIRDQSVTIRFPFRWTQMQENQARLQAELSLDRRDFGVGNGAWLQDDTVGFSVTVRIDLLLNSALELHQ